MSEHEIRFLMVMEYIDMQTGEVRKKSSRKCSDKAQRETAMHVRTGPHCCYVVPKCMLV